MLRAWKYSSSEKVKRVETQLESAVYFAVLIISVDRSYYNYRSGR